MDSLEQKCYDLDVKIRRLEEERMTLMHDNEELVEQLQKQKPESQRTEQDEKICVKIDILKLTEDVGRLDFSIAQLSESQEVVVERVRDIPDLKQSLKKLFNEAGVLKDDVLHLQDHLNIAAKIEVQTNEKVNENRITQLEKIVEDIKLRENTLLHIIEETNTLKDQIDTLRETCFTRTLANDHRDVASAFEFSEATIDQELRSNYVTMLPVLPVNDQFSKHETTVPSKIVGNISLLTSSKKTEDFNLLEDQHYIASNCLSKLLQLWLCFFD